MDVFSIDITQIADLGTQIANSGAVRALEHFADDVFDYMVGVAIVVYEQNPG